MNIFVLDPDPETSARMMCDAHVVKMIVESCQLLSTHDRITLGIGNDDDLRYKITHKNHPCRVCLLNSFNYLWLTIHLRGLLNEYTHRFGKVHKCFNMYKNLWEIDYNGCYNPYCTSFPKCMPDVCKVGGYSIEDIVKSYRLYYMSKQHTMCRFCYTNREMPEWLKGE